MIQMILVEDQQILLDALAESLGRQDNIKVVARILDSAKILAACRTYQPDLVLMDICSKDGSTGIQEAKKIKDQYPNIKVILMTAMPDMNFLEESREAGSDSFIYKNSTIEDFVQCINNTMQDYKVYPDEKDKDPDLELDLSEREEEILRYICQGLNRKEIAGKMFLSENTIRNHITRILSKTGYDSIAQLAIFAVSKGLIVPEP